MLKIYNSLTRAKEPLRPLEDGHVRMYVCGMTVYDYCHIGHARVMVVFDMVARYLRASGYRVTYVRNITDIDDKIIKRAEDNGESIEALTGRFIAAMHEDAAALGVEPPDQEPRALTHMAEITAMVAALLEKGYAYQAANGDVYFRIGRFRDYGRLSGKRLDDLRAGARVEIDEAKRDPLDFVLWKAAKSGEPSWPSPFGPGRPGWHIECSAMSTHCLGAHFDIHGGGMDLMFPHHENEIAQSVAATGEPFVNLWMHNGFVQVDEQKMSKSLGNFFTLREVLKRYHPEVIRLFILSSHYRSPLNYSDQNLDGARTVLNGFYAALQDVAVPESGDQGGDDRGRGFGEAMDDDFNTPVAFAVLNELRSDLNQAKAAGETAEAGVLAARLRRLGAILGLFQQDPGTYFKGVQPVSRSFEASRDIEGAPLKEEEIDALIARRDQARRDRDWAEADRIRDALLAQGVVLEDGAGGTRWRRE